jgi:hypothetical protein
MMVWFARLFILLDFAAMNTPALVAFGGSLITFTTFGIAALNATLPTAIRLYLLKAIATNP